MNGTVWIADDDPLVRMSLAKALRQRGWVVVETANPEDVKLWLTTPGRPVILDGSVWKATGLPLERLPASVLIFSGDEAIVATVRARGLRAFSKGNPGDYGALLEALESEAR